MSGYKHVVIVSKCLLSIFHVLAKDFSTSLEVESLSIVDPKFPSNDIKVHPKTNWTM